MRDSTHLSEARQALLEKLARGDLALVTRNAGTIQHRKNDGPVALSFAQESLWLVEQLAPGNVAYNLPCVLRLEGPLHVAALEQAIHEIVTRHESLRTSFHVQENHPVQVIAPAPNVPLTVVDFTSIPQAEREQRASVYLAVEANQPFDLAAGPLLRTHLLRLGESQHILCIVIHHIISDEWSRDVLLRELTTLYRAFSAGEPSPLPALPVQYADYALWQRERLEKGLAERSLKYWRDQLSDAPAVLELPTDHPRPLVQSTRGARVAFQLSATLSEHLRALGQQEQASLFMTLLAAFQALLSRYSGQDDILVGSPTANRNSPETERLIGYLVNMLVLRTDLSGAPTFRNLLRRVRKVALDAYAHQELPFEKLVEALQPERSLSYSPIFQTMFALENPAPATLETGGLTWQPIELESTTSKLDLALSMRDGAQGLSGFFEYNTDLFEAATIERMVGHWQTLLEGLAAHPDQSIATLPLLTKAEAKQMLVDWNATEAPYQADHCFHQLFEAQAARTPDAIAVVCGKESLTYQQLNERTNQLAHYLRQRGVGPEVLVMLYTRRSLDMLVGLLGILKAGGAYVPLDPSYPKERIALIVEDSQAQIVVTQAALASSWPSQDTEIIALDRDWPAIAEQSQANPESGVTVNNLAYMIYTSGSTGKPKGVMITHQGLPNVTEVLRRNFNTGPASRVLQVASISFDASLWDLLMALPAGGTLYIATDEERIPGPAMLRLLQEQEITIATLTPSALVALPEGDLPALEVVISAAEACTAEIVSRWAKGRRFFNGYGPTETTIGATLAECSDSGYTPSIGRPFINMQTYVLDRSLQPVPVGVVGELCVGGVGLARGYYHRPDLTAEKFIQHPFSSDPTARLYRTGDLVRYRPNGELEFAGRLDHQVKLRGFRIELGEIESAMRQHPAVREALALVLERAGGDKRLVAYVVPSEADALTGTTLRAFLLERLPEYMLPSAFVLLDALPLTSNGKIDRKALPPPDESSLPQGADFVAPRTPTEEQLAAIWADLLGVPQVSVTENFFALGGHSLLAVRVLLRVQERFQVELPLSTLFEAPTVAELALKLVQVEAEQVDDALLSELLAELEETSDAEVHNLLAVEQRIDTGGT
jgi:amino acid adenylation domain-containing protein